jgi:hypothetical protein
MVTTKFNSEGIVLVGADRNEFVQVITIDPKQSIIRLYNSNYVDALEPRFHIRGQMHNYLTEIT